MRFGTLVAALAMTFASMGSAANAARYYLFDGDARRAVAIDNGVVAFGFDIPSLGYLVSVTNSIWLGDRDDRGSVEFTLNGTPTGRTATGGAAFSQLLDGTGDGTHNYGVTCCTANNAVTIADADWSNQHVLFGLNDNSSGIAFDSRSNSLYVVGYDRVISNYALSGALLSTSAPVDGFLAGLAYDRTSDTLYGWNRSSSSLEQYSLSGTRLGTHYVNVASYGVNNPFGGEIGNVPEPAVWAMMLTGFGLVGFAARRAVRRSEQRLALEIARRSVAD